MALRKSHSSPSSSSSSAGRRSNVDNAQKSRKRCAAFCELARVFLSLDCFLFLLVCSFLPYKSNFESKIALVERRRSCRASVKRIIVGLPFARALNGGRRALAPHVRTGGRRRFRCDCVLTRARECERARASIRQAPSQGALALIVAVMMAAAATASAAANRKESFARRFTLRARFCILLASRLIALAHNCSRILKSNDGRR